MNVIWSRLDRRKMKTSDTLFFKWQGANLRIMLIILLCLSMLVLPIKLSMDGRITLLTYIAATYCWVATPLPPALVAIGAVLFLTVTGTTSQELLYTSLSSDVIWLMIGAFIVGGAIQETGLGNRAVMYIAKKANSVTGLFFLLTIIIQLLSLFIPSTSGRASVLLPVYRDLTKTINNLMVTKALSLLIPVIILIATSSTLIGASSHLIANNYLEKTGFGKISFFTWMVWGVPFSLTASLIACTVILKMYLDRETREIELKKINLAINSDVPLTKNEKITISAFGMLILLWMTEDLHGLEIGTVTMLGAFGLLLPRIGVLSWKKGLQSVSWNLLLFVGAAIALGEALIESGAAEWIIGLVLSVTEVVLFRSELLTFLLLALISTSSHLYITSHTMRVIILIPPILSLSLSEGLNLGPTVFLLMVGMNYCLTLPVSSKALLIYSNEEGGLQARDLRRLSKVLIIFYLTLMFLFYVTYWRWTGLSL